MTEDESGASLRLFTQPRDVLLVRVLVGVPRGLRWVWEWALSQGLFLRKVGGPEDCRLPVIYLSPDSSSCDFPMKVHTWHMKVKKQRRFSLHFRIVLQLEHRPSRPEGPQNCRSRVGWEEPRRDFTGTLRSLWSTSLGTFPRYRFRYVRREKGLLSLRVTTGSCRDTRRWNQYQ